MYLPTHTGNNNIAFIIGNGPSVSYESSLIIQSYYNLSGQPLIFGDLSNNILYINTTSNTTSDNNTHLVVNGRAYAKSFVPFTGLHKVLIPNFSSLNLQMGMLLPSTRCLSKADPLNPVIECALAVQPKDKTIYVVYSNTEMLNGETVHYGAAVGEGCILATDFNGPIVNGDYLTSSYGGYGQRQDDDLLHSYTVAKAIESIDWGAITDTVEMNGSSYKKALIACVFLCG